MRRYDPISERDRVAWLASINCYKCMGLGMIVTYHHKTNLNPPMRLCDCVHRAAFRKCFNHYHYLRGRDDLARHPKLTHRPSLGTTYEFRRIDFIADIEYTAAHNLPWLHRQIWRVAYQCRLEWHACTPLIGCTRAQFFHASYEMEQHLGKLWIELGMLPGVYFTRTIPREKAAAA